MFWGGRVDIKIVQYTCSFDSNWQLMGVEIIMVKRVIIHAVNAIGLWRATHRYRSDDSLERVSRTYFLLFQWLEYALSTTPQNQYVVINLILSDVFGCDSCMCVLFSIIQF